MKAELNEDNKAKFYFLHYGQPILILDECNPAYFTWYRFLDNFLLNNQGDNYGYLLMKSLSEITDEDAIECGTILGLGLTWQYQAKVDWVKDYLTRPDNIRTSIGDAFNKSSYVVDYLRSKGYALPCNGLSVEEIVEAGWIKLVK